MISWGYETDGLCLLCGTEMESHNHLFFQCSFTAFVWRNLFLHLQLSNVPMAWDPLLTWLQDIHLDVTTRLALLQAWQGAIYELWKERNRRMHDGVTLSHSHVLRLVLSSVKDKCRALCNLGSSQGDLLLQKWSHSNGFS
ncbi:unnamed protein product [Microthlaspi erraticum]|uniref:Reverse transcriptase zinc-binding domain-containing protein n=1 Tax=Microthlaspi erraticum TaxID=1685480 RepID=A0A6D2JPZ9_9BRAS|nr:unnamed protein product [Microthlaspi erraticum]